MPRYCTCLIKVLIQAGHHNINLKRQFDLKMVNATMLPATCHVDANSEPGGTIFGREGYVRS